MTTTKTFTTKKPKRARTRTERLGDGTLILLGGQTRITGESAQIATCGTNPDHTSDNTWCVGTVNIPNQQHHGRAYGATLMPYTNTSGNFPSFTSPLPTSFSSSASGAKILYTFFITADCCRCTRHCTSKQRLRTFF